MTIEQITAAIHARAEGSRYADIDNEVVLKKINAYKTEWSLYGTVELENKITAYNNSMQVLVDGEAIVLKPNSQEAKKWSELNADEKTEYGYYEGNYKYSVYMNLYNEKMSCQSYLNQLNAKVKVSESIRDTAQANRNKLVKLVEIESYNRAELNKIVPLPSSTVANTFTEEEIQTINLLYVDKNYSNENILTTSLDTTVSEIDIQYELLEDAKEQLSIESQPQISFNANIENLLVIPEFKGFDFKVGNFVSLEYYDDYYVDMRLISMTFNPCIPEHSLAVSFSNFIKSKSERTDVSNILGLAVGNSSGSSSGGGSGGNSLNFGVGNDIDVTISNTMLSKLLNTEMFGTRVSNIILDTIKVNEITAKYAKFEGLAKGTTIIDGKCIMTGYIIDQFYNGKDGDITNTKGSVINLETGKFNFGGGSLKYDGTALTVKGAIYADSGYIGGESGFTIAAGKLYSNGHSAYNTPKEGVYIGTDYISLGNGGVTYFKNDGTGKIGTWYVNANSIYRVSPSWGANGGMYFGTSGLSISDVFKVDSAGNTSITDKFKVTSGGALTATSATITGDITATKLTATQEGNIAGWMFNNSCIYRGSSVFGNASGMYFGASGLSITNKFKVWSNGNFNFGDGKLVFNGSKLTLGSDVTLSWGQIDGADAKVTQITKDTVTTEYLVATNLHVKSANIDGKITASQINTTGLIAENISATTIYGKVFSGCTGEFSGNITASSFKYSDSQFECTVSSGFQIYNKSNSIATSFSIYGVHGSMALFSDSLEFYTGNSFNGQNGSFWHDSEGFHFSRRIDIGLNSIRAGDGFATIVDCTTKGKFYYGASSSYADESALSALRGKTVRIYSHGGGVYLGSSGSTAISSDENFKDLSDIDERYEQFFYNLKPTLYKYKIGHRQHIGFGARAVENALQKAGLSTEEFAGILIDKNVDIGKDEILDLDGNTHFEELYYLRYEEFISLNTLMLQKALSRITELENTIKEMKG